MTALVIDASIAASWCFADEHTDFTNEILRVVTYSLGAYAPRLWTYEIRNSVLMGLRRKRLTKNDARDFLVSLDALNIRLLDPLSLEVVFALAERHGLTFYDAAYLDLAISRNLPLASLDKELRHAAMQSGVTVFQP